MKFIDVHAHLDRLKKVAKVVERARDKGVYIIVSCGIDLDSDEKTIEYIRKYPEVKGILGLHPLDIASTSEKDIKEVISFIRKHKENIIGIGEIGIDMKEEVNFDEQKKIFEKMIVLAKELDKPVLVHSRKAELECIEILETHKMKKVIMHCFSGRKALLKRIEDNGWFISIPASIKYSEQFQLFAKLMPLENIFCETDSPFLHPDRERDNEPVNVIESYKKIAEIKKINIKDVCGEISENFEKLFC